MTDDVEYEKNRRNYVLAARLAKESELGGEALKELRRAAVRQFIVEYRNFEGTTLLVGEYEFTSDETRRLIADILSDPNIDKDGRAAFDDKGTVVFKTLKEQVTEWYRRHYQQPLESRSNV